MGDNSICLIFKLNTKCVTSLENVSKLITFTVNVKIEN